MKKNEQQGLLPLPYEPVSELPTRDKLREATSSGHLKRGKEGYYIHIDNIIVLEGFNPRLNIANLPMQIWLNDKLQIADFADTLWKNGNPPPALIGDMTPDALNFIIRDGHRRYYALKRLLALGKTTWASGKPLNMVEISILPKEYTELDRAKLTYLSQNNLKLDPIDSGHYFLRLNRVFGMSHEDIAQTLNGSKSRQYITNMIALAQEPEEIQIAVINGHLTPTTAVNLIYKVKDVEKRLEAVRESIQSGHPIKVKNVSDLVISEETNDDIPEEEIIPEIHIAEEDETEDEEQEDDKYIDNVIDIRIDEFATISPVKVDTKEADKKEEESHKTASKVPIVPPSKGSNDALPMIDFTHEKDEAVMDCTEIISFADKITVRLKNIYMPEGHRKDIEAMLELIARKGEKVREVVRKAADQR